MTLGWTRTNICFREKYITGLPQQGKIFVSQIMSKLLNHRSMTKFEWFLFCSEILVLGLLIFFSVIIGNYACCPENRKIHSNKDCSRCSECTDELYDPKMPNAETWCKAPICGIVNTIPFSLILSRCPATFYGMCAVKKCNTGPIFLFKLDYHGECKTRTQLMYEKYLNETFQQTKHNHNRFIRRTWIKNKINSENLSDNLKYR